MQIEVSTGQPREARITLSSEELYYLKIALERAKKAGNKGRPGRPTTPSGKDEKGKGNDKGKGAGAKR